MCVFVYLSLLGFDLHRVAASCRIGDQSGKERGWVGMLVRLPGIEIGRTGIVAHLTDARTIVQNVQDDPR